MFRGLFQPMHLIVILVIVLVIFGPGRLPELGAGIGKGLRELKKALSHDGSDSETKEATGEDKEKKV